MSDEPKLPSYEQLEDAFRGKPVDILARLPRNTASRRAAEHLDLAYGYAKESRERPDDGHDR